MIHTGYHKIPLLRNASDLPSTRYQGFEAEEAEWDQWALAKVVGCTVVQFGDVLTPFR